ncbi:HEAT repeat domain-containing protein [Roseimaritima sediminicola]|uniref:HEAT repeat domain-containing protein n=1 Tax=Roseimaritima sediminicola TaxID=2662066 RepID=UPI00129852DA|nr:HEAT repeat domain-containing protein [Roseimaritima sediminicola]
MSNPIVRTSRLVTTYRRYLASADTLRFAQQVSETYFPSTLAKLLQMGSIEERRAASLALGIVGDGTVVETLGRALSDEDRGVRLAADDAFRATLVRGAAPAHRQQLLQVMHLNDGGEFAAGLPPAMILANQAPHYAEAMHQMGICWEGLNNPDEAEAAYRGCLWLCRFHYPAWIGVARCRLERNELGSALRALDRATAICPDLEVPRAQARAIRRRLGISERQG